ncbi:MAG: ComEC/Rec2 family competence protein [bacterium]|nr:ComEC/Rec2 family competence protein [bacterium]
MFDYLLISVVLIGIFLFSTISRNVSADIAVGSARISFLDVGQGDAALISLPDNMQILIDAGRTSAVVARIKSRMPAFDNEIEKVILTHADSDHIGGMEGVLESFKVGRVYFNSSDSESKTYAKLLEKIKEKNVTQLSAQAGDNIYEGDLKLEVVWPEKDLSMSGNNLSIVVIAEVENSRALLTGDIELEAEQKLVDKYKEEELLSDLYKVPHHGSGGAWHEGFLKKAGARNAVISVGENNSYGHPAKNVLDGLDKLGLKIYRTDEIGTIDFVSSDSGWVKK